MKLECVQIKVPGVMSGPFGFVGDMYAFYLQGNSSCRANSKASATVMSSGKGASG